MAWTGSKIFRPFLGAVFGNNTAHDLESDIPKVTLWDNDITPDANVTEANSALGAGQWVSAGNEVFEAGQWAQGGVALSSPTLNTGSANVVFYDAADTESGTAADLPNVYGVHVNNDTITTPVADPGICFNYLGGLNAVVNGKLTIQWHGSGIWQVTI